MHERIRVHAAWLAALLSLALACGSEETPTGVGSRPMNASEPVAEVGDLSLGSPPVIDRLEISPEEVVVGREIRVIAEASDPDGGPIRFEFVWTRNGEEVQRSSRPAVTFYELEKSDSVALEAIATDGRNQSSPVRLRARVGNRKPTLTKLEIEPPSDLRAGMKVTATPYAEDPDNDRLSFEYSWRVNGVEKGTERSFDTTGLRRGDELLLRVKALDGETTSSPHEVAVKLGNTPPTIRSAGEKPVAGLYRHQFVGDDIDGDRNLRFFLEKGPTGMTMDAITGMLSWKPEGATAGRHDVVVGVRDSNGDGSTFSFAVNVANETQPAGESPPAAQAP